MSREDSEPTFSLIPTPSRELVVSHGAENRILGEMIESSLLLARESAVAPVELDALVVKIANDFANRGLPLTDLLFEGKKGLAKAIERFKPEKGRKFHTYATWWIKQTIKKALAVILHDKESAAEHGDAETQYKLGICFDNGRDIPRYNAKAAKWFRKAAEQGHAAAQKSIGECYLYGNGIHEDTQTGLMWLKKSAEQGNWSAQFALGMYYELGIIGVPKDDNEAFKWYRRAAERGKASDQKRLGIFYRDGVGVEQNYTEAAFWFAKAAEQGNAEAQSNLAYCYSAGRGVPQNEANAVNWWRKAAERGDVNAQLYLGGCYKKS